MAQLMNILPAWKERTQENSFKLLELFCKSGKPKEVLPSLEWSTKYRFLGKEEAAKSGLYNISAIPWAAEIYEALDNPEFHTVVCQKPAQSTWTTIVANWIGRNIDCDPSVMIVMGASAGAIKKFRLEKLQPMASSSPRLRSKVDISDSRKKGQTWDHIPFKDGFLKLVGSFSPSGVKSTSAPRVIVEEPDDSTDDVKDQGDSLDMLIERTKTFGKNLRKIVYGGTPKQAHDSKVVFAMKLSDKRVLMIPCHDCGDTHELSWKNIKWQNDAEEVHEIFGRNVPSSAFYACPNCGSVWSDFRKNLNLKKARFKATAKSDGVAGFYLNELALPWEASSFKDLVSRYLKAKHKLAGGDDEPMKVFYNSALGIPYEPERDVDIETIDFDKRAEPYSPTVIPEGGYIVTFGVDIQHNRIAYKAKAWGYQEESWLLVVDEIFGNPKDKDDPIWLELDKILGQQFDHALGWKVKASAISIDSSDGQTSDEVYHYVRTRKNLAPNIMAIKGWSIDYGVREVYTRPASSIDSKKSNKTKASKYGLKVFMVGTHKGKDLIYKRLSLEGSGAGRMHWHKDTRPDYFDQLLGEVKVVDRKSGREKYVKKSGQAVEFLDCENYALHAARSLSVHTMKQSDFDSIAEHHNALTGNGKVVSLKDRYTKLGQNA